MVKPRILIVDDDAKITGFMHAILEKAGDFEVLEENRSFAALRVAETFRPNMVVLDVDMPGKTGGDVAAEMAVHATLSRVPVLFVTSLIPPQEAHTGCVRRGEHYFLSKPVMPRLLLATVNAMLSGSEVPLANGGN